MKILNVHNRHVGPGGTEIMFGAITRLLRSRGHDVVEVHRDNADLKSLWQKIGAFGSAIYSPAAYREFVRLIRTEKPDLAHVHNLYPQLSVSILDACRENGVPVVLHVHDYKITCPTAQHLRNGQPCDKCTRLGEHWCAIHNCRGSLPMSVSYAIRNAYARSSGKIHDAVSLYICCSEFVRSRVVAGGYPAQRVVAVNNFFELPPFTGRSGEGEYIAYVGRISPEKGIDVLLACARETGLPVRIAGDPDGMPGIVERAPANVRFTGKLDRVQMQGFLDGARLLVVPSIWWEAFGLVAAEAMSRQLPVIATRTGGLGEVVDHDVNGLLIEPNNVGALSDAVRALWDDSTRRAAMGRAGRSKAERLYSPDTYYQNLMSAYARVLPRNPASPAGVSSRGLSTPMGENGHVSDARITPLARAS